MIHVFRREFQLVKQLAVSHQSQNCRNFLNVQKNFAIFARFIGFFPPYQTFRARNENVDTIKLYS